MGRTHKRVLDACCGSKMFWFDRQHPEAVYLDKRRETHVLKDKSSKGGSRTLVIDPDVIGDFTALPFADETFPLVVFDPPHLVNNGRSGWMAKKYGKLEGDWKEEIRKGFAECFRVLKADGVLVFKWNENDVLLSEIMPLTPVQPLIGHKGGRGMKTHWLVFLKPAAQSSECSHPNSLIDPTTCSCKGCGKVFPQSPISQTQTDNKDG